MRKHFFCYCIELLAKITVQKSDNLYSHILCWSLLLVGNLSCWLILWFAFVVFYHLLELFFCCLKEKDNSSWLTLTWLARPHAVAAGQYGMNSLTSGKPTLQFTHHLWLTFWACDDKSIENLTNNPGAMRVMKFFRLTGNFCCIETTGA